MNIFVVGASGFIGSSLARGLAILGHEVTAVSRTALSKINGNRVHGVVASINKDVLGPLLVERRPNVLVHCVGAPTVRCAQSNSRQDFGVTVVILSEVLESLREFSPETSFVLVSSAAVYGDRNGDFLNESLSPQPVSVYGYNKCIAELLVQQYSSQFGLNTLIVRPFSLYGADLRKQVIFDLSRRFLDHPNELSVYGTGQEIRDFLHIDDFVADVAHLLDLGLTGVFNVASGIPTTLADLASMIGGHLSPATRIVFSGDVSCENPMSLVADITKISNLGLRQTVLLDVGISRVCASLRRDWNATK